MVTKRVLTIAQFSQSYAIGRTKAYEEITSGRLKTFYLGRRRLIKSEDAENWLDMIVSPRSKHGRPDFWADNTKGK
jgi:hypothetical protein